MQETPLSEQHRALSPPPRPPFFLCALTREVGVTLITCSQPLTSITLTVGLRNMSFSIKRLFSGSFSTDPTDDHSVSRADGAAENDSFGTQEALSFDTATPHATAALASIKPLDLRALGSATTTDSEPPLHRSPPSSGPNGDSEDDAGNAAELQAKLREARQQVADLQILREETAAKLAAAEARSREAEAAFERMSSGLLLSPSRAIQDVAAKHCSPPPLYPFASINDRSCRGFGGTVARSGGRLHRGGAGGIVACSMHCSDDNHTFVGRRMGMDVVLWSMTCCYCTGEGRFVLTAVFQALCVANKVQQDRLWRSRKAHADKGRQLEHAGSL